VLFSRWVEEDGHNKQCEATGLNNTSTQSRARRSRYTVAQGIEDVTEGTGIKRQTYSKCLRMLTKKEYEFLVHNREEE